MILQSLLCRIEVEYVIRCQKSLRNLGVTFIAETTAKPIGFIG
jgi:hypothetical protein